MGAHALFICKASLKDIRSSRKCLTYQIRAWDPVPKLPHLGWKKSELCPIMVAPKVSLKLQLTNWKCSIVRMRDMISHEQQ